MRRSQRLVLLATLIAIAPAMVGCADFDPDKLDIFHLNDKKKLQGDRQPLFPEGVPGVTQGIPPEYVKGNEQQQTGAAIPMPAADSAAAAEPAKQAAVAEPPKAKPKPKPKPKKRVVKRKPKPTPKPVASTTSATPQEKPAASTASSPAPWPAPAQSSSTAPWPSAPPPGTFTR